MQLKDVSAGFSNIGILQEHSLRVVGEKGWSSTFPIASSVGGGVGRVFASAS